MCYFSSVASPSAGFHLYCPLGLHEVLSFRVLCILCQDLLAFSCLGWQNSWDPDWFTSKHESHFPLAALKILSLFYLLGHVMMMCLGVGLLSFCIFGILSASCLWFSFSFIRFGKLSVVISFKRLCTPLVCTSEPSSTPANLRSGLLMLSGLSSRWCKIIMDLVDQFT